jgi:hypothetical protein
MNIACFCSSGLCSSANVVCCAAGGCSSVNPLYYCFADRCCKFNIV